MPRALSATSYPYAFDPSLLPESRLLLLRSESAKATEALTLFRALRFAPPWDP